MSVRYEGSGEIDCTIQQVQRAFENPGEHYVGVVSLMPGMTSAEQVEQGSDSVTIGTNEGLMKGTGITRRVEADSVAVEFDEEYRAGSRARTASS